MDTQSLSIQSPKQVDVDFIIQVLEEKKEQWLESARHTEGLGAVKTAEWHWGHVDAFKEMVEFFKK